MVANRGEIAIRIMRACEELGIKTIAVYSDQDEHAPHVKRADEAYRIGGSIPQDSYLNIQSIVDVIHESEADAVHPGYGFLSENPEFAEAVEATEAAWVAPPSKAMRFGGEKSYCKKIAKENDVPVIPGSTETVEDIDEIYDFFSEYGSLMLKLDKGGGGKGIRRITKEEQIEDAYKSCRSEGEAAFGSPDIYVEKLFEKPRHIEVQILADNHGNYISLGERECSIQRRTQKIIEEAPSPVVDEEDRQYLSKLAVRMAKATNYRNAGTMEFLRGSDGNFYFMEINARLQVEHPITEKVTGVGIVKEQFRIAADEELQIDQDEVEMSGHSIESRIYSEDPENFAPSPGTIEKAELVPQNKHVRIDHCVGDGVSVPPFYDPLIAKLIVWDDDRQKAIQRMNEALSDITIEGVKTSIPFLKKVFNDEDYIQNNIHTSFIDHKYLGNTG